MFPGQNPLAATEEKVTSLPEQNRDRRSSGGCCDHEEREQEPGEKDERRPEKGGTTSDRLMLDVERAPSPPENTGNCEITDRLDDIRTPQKIEDTETEQERDRNVDRSAAPAVKVVGADEEDGGNRNREGMEDTQLMNRRHLGEQPPTPANIWHDGRHEIDYCDRGSRERRDQRQRISAAEHPKRVRASMETETPRRRVPSTRGQVAPVLGDQPETGQRGDHRRKAVVHKPDQRANHERQQHDDTEMPVVPAQAQKVNPRPQRVLLDPEAPSAQSLPAAHVPGYVSPCLAE